MTDAVEKVGDLRRGPPFNRLAPSEASGDNTD
jgi:hypothetical protein